MDLLTGLITLLIYVAIAVLIFELLVWGLRNLVPETPARVIQIIRVILVLIVLYLVIAWLMRALPVPPLLR